MDLNLNFFHEINQKIAAKFFEKYDRFLTAMCIYIDFELKLLKLARAGHEPLFIHRRCDDITLIAIDIE